MEELDVHGSLASIKSLRGVSLSGTLVSLARTFKDGEPYALLPYGTLSDYGMSPLSGSMGFDKANETFLSMCNFQSSREVESVKLYGQLAAANYELDKLSDKFIEVLKQELRKLKHVDGDTEGICISTLAILTIAA